MNIFEDLIEELKEENLLEETVVATNQAKNKTAAPAGANAAEAKTPKAENLKETRDEPHKKNPLPENESAAIDSDFFEEVAKNSKQPDSEIEFYRKRAMEEVAFLQMVEHVFAGVEREQMKIAPKPYDDLEVKKVLHSFLQVSGDVKSPEHAQLEFRLLQETENWYSALSHRDKRISVSNLRRYCETTRPALSAPALVALGRFYRNSPYSEQVRSKFDFVLTKLFTRDVGNEKRQLAFSRDEIIKHLNGLYADWSSIPLYSTDEDDSEILLMALKFEDFISEIGSVENFDELVRSDFFNRLRGFKESTNEQFYAPLIAVAAVESNVRIGNRYVELLHKEREKGESAQTGNKYGFLHDQVISDATSKTLHLVELLKGNREPGAEQNVASNENEAAKTDAPRRKAARSVKKETSSFFRVNKWLLTVTVLSIILSFGLYFWANSQDTTEKISPNVKKVNLENSMLKDFIKEARISDDTFFGVVLPSWDGLSRDKKEDLLKKIESIGNEKGFKNVHLLNKEGRSVGSAFNENITIIN